jgi:DNA-binding transcriptional LysR family regulator
VIGAEFDNLESIKRAVISGVCLTVLPPYVVAGEVAAATLRALPVDGDSFQRTLKLIRERDSHLAPVARAFLETMTADYPALGDVLTMG